MTRLREDSSLDYLDALNVARELLKRGCRRSVISSLLEGVRDVDLNRMASELRVSRPRGGTYRSLAGFFRTARAQADVLLLLHLGSTANEQSNWSPGERLLWIFDSYRHIRARNIVFTIEQTHLILTSWASGLIQIRRCQCHESFAVSTMSPASECPMCLIRKTSRCGACGLKYTHPPSQQNRRVCQCADETA